MKVTCPRITSSRDLQHLTSLQKAKRKAHPLCLKIVPNHDKPDFLRLTHMPSIFGRTMNCNVLPHLIPQKGHFNENTQVRSHCLLNLPLSISWTSLNMSFFVSWTMVFNSLSKVSTSRSQSIRLYTEFILFRYISINTNYFTENSNEDLHHVHNNRRWPLYVCFAQTENRWDPNTQEIISIYTEARVYKILDRFINSLSLCFVTRSSHSSTLCWMIHSETAFVSLSLHHLWSKPAFLFCQIRSLVMRWD